MSLNPTTFRVANVASTVKRQFGDEAGVQIDDTDIIRWVNEGQTEIAQILKSLKAKSTSQSVVGQREYLFPSDRIIQVESLHYNGRKIENVPFLVAEDRIMASDPDRVSSGVPLLWYEWAGTFTFWPTPDSIESIEIYYTKTPDPVTAVGDFIGVPDKHYDSLIYYVMAKAYELDEEFEASSAQRQLFQNRILDQHDEERQAQHMSYPSINIIED